MEKRIVLTKEDFDILISGKILEKENVKVILQDIGYEKMIDMIEQKLKELCTSV